MKELVIILFLVLHCSEKESKQKETVGSSYDDPAKLPYTLNGFEIKYNDFIYYDMPRKESDFPVQIKNYEKEIQVFLPFAEQFRQDILKKDPKEIIKYFSAERKRKIQKYLKEEHCLSFKINELTTEKLSELNDLGKLHLKKPLDYFYTGLTERKAPLIIDILFYKWTNEEIYIIMVAPKYPNSVMDEAFLFKKKSAGQFEMDGYANLVSGDKRGYYDSFREDMAPDDKTHKFLPYQSECLKDGTKK